MQITVGLGKQNSFQHWVKYLAQGHDYGSRGIDPPTFQLVDDLLYLLSVITLLTVIGSK